MLDYWLFWLSEPRDFWPLAVFLQLFHLFGGSALLKLALGLQWTPALVFVQLSLWNLKLIYAEILSWAERFTASYLVVFDLALFALIVGFLLWLFIRGMRLAPPQLRREEIFPTFGLGLGLSVLLVAAIMVPQSNWDSLTYHLPRALMWLQEGSLSFFDTNNSRENFTQILPSVLYAYGLSYSPWGLGVALPNWIAAVLVLLSIRYLVVALTGPGLGPVLATVFAASIPMFAIQAASTQTDLLSSAGLAGLLTAIGRGLNSPSNRLAKLDIASIALAVSFAIASKATSAILLLPVLILFPWLARLSSKLGHLWRAAVVSTIAIIFTSGPFLYRLHNAGGDVSDTAKAVFVADPSAYEIFGNLIKFALASAQLPVPAWSRALEGFGASMENLFGVPIDSAATNFGDYNFFIISEFFGDSSVGWPLHIAVLLIFGVIALVTGRWNSRVSLWFLVGILQFILMASLIRWQPWIARFTFPIFFSFAVVIGLLTPVIALWARKLLAFFGVVLLILVAVWLPGRSILPRPDLQSLVLGSVEVQRPNFFFGQKDPFPTSPTQGSAESAREAVSRASEHRIKSLYVRAGGDTPKFHYWVAARTVLPPLRVTYVPPKKGGAFIEACSSKCAPSEDLEYREKFLIKDTLYRIGNP